MSRGDGFGRLGAVARHDLRILQRDPAFLIIFTVMPPSMTRFCPVMKPASRARNRQALAISSGEFESGSRPR